MTEIETSTSGDTEIQEIILSGSSSDIYVESDDDNPVHIYYNADNTPIVVDEVDITQKDGKVIKPKKSYLRDVRNSKRRRFK